MELNDIFSNDIDPEIAALLSDSDSGPSKVSAPPTPKKTVVKAENSPKFDSMFGNMDVSGKAKEKSPTKVDLSVTKFDHIEKILSDKPHQIFSDPEYYKKALGGEGEKAQKMHNLLSKYLSCQDPKDKAVFRQQIITAYWDLMRGIVPKASGSNPVLPKKYLLRFGLLLPSLLTPEAKDLFSRVNDTNTYGEPVYYLDEWFRDVSLGKITPSATDEAKVSKRDESSHNQQLLNRAQGKLQSAENLLKAKSDERTRAENSIKEKLDSICQHEFMRGYMHLKAPYTEPQKRTIQEISEALRNLVKLDKELMGYASDYEQANSDVRSIEEKIESAGGAAVNTQSAVTELETIRQMTKMTVGRQGNHFPILTKEYFHNSSRDIGIRENVINTLAWIESIDQEAYCRAYKNQLNRIVPFTILIPSYGDFGICWEPFDRYNRVTSRGRIAVPMYPKNLTLAVLTAVGDLRWQVAKEKASYYWMEEGLTGNYYQYIQSKKLKGDLKELFINDYILWMTKESDGVQRLDKEVRAIFWRFMPFSKEIKAKLKTRSYVYQELCQRDLNREMSDGY